MGFADSPATIDTLAGYDIRVSGWRWQWAVGLKGGTFPPHLDLNQQFESTADSYPAYPGEDVNGDSCACALVPVYRTSDGRFAKPDNLKPIFQPPVTASQQVEVYRPEPFDLTPLTELAERLGTPPPVYVTVAIPEGGIRVNLPQINLPAFPAQQAPVVNVAAPNVQVDSPQIRVDAPVVNVAAPEVSVSPNITVQPAKVQVIREKIIQKVRFRRNQSGQIETAEVDQ